MGSPLVCGSMSSRVLSLFFTVGMSMISLQSLIIKMRRNNLPYLNSKHKNIKFTMGTEKDKKLPFLDVYLDNSGSKLITRVDRKYTFSGLLTNYFSFTAMRYKILLIRCLIDKVHNINNIIMGRYSWRFEKSVLCSQTKLLPWIHHQ